jgi:hypothetical protein
VCCVLVEVKVLTFCVYFMCPGKKADTILVSGLALRVIT